MKTRINTLILFIFFIEFSFAKLELPNNLEIKSNITSYFVDKCPMTIITYNYFNKSNETIWLWFEKKEQIKSTDNEKIKRYFLNKKPNEDFSFYEIGMDSNVEQFIPNISFSFIKRIIPNHFFSVQIITNKKIDEKVKQKICSYIKNNILTYTEQKMTSVIPTIDRMSDLFFYKEDFIILNLNMLKL